MSSCREIEQSPRVVSPFVRCWSTAPDGIDRKTGIEAESQRIQLVCLASVDSPVMPVRRRNKPMVENPLAVWIGGTRNRNESFTNRVAAGTKRPDTRAATKPPRPLEVWANQED